MLDDEITAVLIGGNHLACHIGADHPPADASVDEALEHYGAGWRFDVWCCWRAIMKLRDHGAAAAG